MSKRKNIIFVQCDSMDGRAMGCVGHPAMANATPNLDRLARQGVLFENTYCNNPVCCPSRASMWSGQYTHHCEGWNNYKGLSEETPTFRTQLDNAGYKTCTFGKTDYLSGYHTIRARVSPWTRSADIKRPNYNMEAPVILDNTETRIHEDDWDSVDKSIDWLENNAGTDDKPFMLYVGLKQPHPRFLTSKSYLNMIDDAGVEIPPEDESRHPVMKYQRINKNWMHGFDKEMIFKIRKIYFAMIAEVDAMVGAILNKVEQMGISDNTCIIFASDHGELAMEHRQFYKMSAYEPSARVPLIISGPGIKNGERVQKLVSLVDIYPTFMDMADITYPEGLDGYSLMPELTGGESENPDWVLTEFHGSTSNTGWFMLRRNEWKYVVYVGYEPQLFNLKKDPWEINNLAEANAEVVSEMDKLLRKIVDYEKVDAKVKAYDKKSFREWRAKRLEEGTYYDLMSRIFSGWDNMDEKDIVPWTEEDDKKIVEWMNSEEGHQ